MSKNTSTGKKAKQFSYTPTNELPPLGKIKTEWDLKGHYYKSENDPQIEKDAKKYERAIRAFVKRYKHSNFTSSAKKLLTALKDNEKIAEMPHGSKVISYFYYRTNKNAGDTVANRFSTLFAERFKKLANEALFFHLEIGKIPPAKQKEYLQDPSLTKYHYFLAEIFTEAKHHLTEAEERILTLRSGTSRSMWAEAVSKTVSKRQITFKGKQYALPEALESIDNLSWSEKSKLWSLILDEMVQIGEFAEHELSAIVTHAKVTDELRGYKKPYSATVAAYENDEKSVEALVDAITTKGFPLSRRFYKLKAKLHGKDHIPYVNKYDPIGSLEKPDAETCIDICRDSFYTLDNRYGEIFDMMLENGHIDFYPKAGKRGGAFMHGDVGLPTYVMLNHTDDFKSLQTMAHEVGHAIHGEISKAQPAIYEDFSITTAETASTLFEQFVSDTVFEKLEEKHKASYLHDKITRDIATVQRQTAFFNFELEMHNHIREHGLATKEELAHMLQQHLKVHLGPAVEVTERDGYTFVFVGHFRYGFYVYTYTYGHLVSNLMVQRYRQDKTYLHKINGFLSAGGKDTVENIFKEANINTRKVETFTESLKTHEQEIKTLEKLTKKQQSRWK